MSNPNGKNRNTAIVLFAVVGGMVGLAFASVPLYQAFCRVTGYGGTTAKVAANSGPAVAANTPMITVQFDTNVDHALPWSFKPDQREIKVHVGEGSLATFSAINTGNRTITGNATFNVTPYKAGQYFKKIECFCFTEQKLEPSETASMPVTFFVDPEILTDPNTVDVKTITLSYTFYPAKTDKDQQARKDKTAPKNANLAIQGASNPLPITKSNLKS